jgi:hypothetical protein
VKICEKGMEFIDRRDPYHLCAERGGIWKAFAIPTQVLSHTIELLFPDQRLELLRMVDQHGEALVQRYLTGVSSTVSTVHTTGSHAGLLF